MFLQALPWIRRKWDWAKVSRGNKQRERRKIEEERRQEEERILIEELAQEKDAIISSVSHELRNPLNLILGNVDFLIKGAKHD